MRSATRNRRAGQGTMFDDGNIPECLREYMNRWMCSVEVAERHLRIRRLIHDAGRVDSAELAKALSVPLATIEADLRFLERIADETPKDDEALRAMRRDRRQG